MRKKAFNKTYINPRHARNSSNFSLKLLIESHATISSDKLLQVFTTLCEKENFLISKLQSCLTSFSECPLVGAFVN
jgi:hypothetical protein